MHFQDKNLRQKHAKFLITLKLVHFDYFRVYCRCPTIALSRCKTSGKNMQIFSLHGKWSILTLLQQFYYFPFHEKPSGKIVHIFSLHRNWSILTLKQSTIVVQPLYFHEKTSGKIMQIFSLHRNWSILTLWILQQVSNYLR